MTISQSLPLVAVVALAFMGATAEIGYCAGWRLNLTASEPLGLYRLQPLGIAPIPRGTRIEFCPPAWVTPIAYPFYMSGDCPSGGRAMLKTVLGVPGDQISATEEGLTINGTQVPGSASRLRSIRYSEILLPRFRETLVLQSGQYWVYGSGERPELAALSFDSRYYGPIRVEWIRGLLFRAGVPAW